MTLTTRLLLFYLGSLVVLLAGFSTALYLVAQEHLYRQADERLDAALNTLGAAVEAAPDGVEWEPNDRTIRIAPGPDQIAWVVTDDAGRVVARSERPDSDDLLTEAAGRFRGPADATRRLYWRGERWQAGQRWFRPGGTTTVGGEGQLPNRKEGKYPALVITTALPLEPTRAVLHELLAVLVAISLGVLSVALVAGRFVCRRASDLSAGWPRTHAPCGRPTPSAGSSRQAAATSSPTWGRPSTACSTACTSRQSATVGSPGTLLTSFARRWPHCWVKSRSPCAGTGRRASTGTC